MVLSQAPDAVIFPPSDLYSDEPPLESDLHLEQILLLLWCLKWWWRERPDAPQSRRNNFYAAGNLTIYYSNRQRRNEKFRGPDFFVVLGTEYKPRKSWVVWEEEGKYPNVIVEMLSDSTAEVDRGEKKEIYQNTFRTPEYFWFDPYTFEFQGFRLRESVYQAIEPTEQGWLWSQQLELYLGVVEEKLRFLTPEGELVPAPTEAVLQERLQSEAERQRADTERQRADTERQRAEAAEAELERLRQQIQERGATAE
jgi:Uma2 family endonuclease